MEKKIFIIYKLTEVKTHEKSFQSIKSVRRTDVITAFQQTSKYYEKTGTLRKKLLRNTRMHNNG